MSTASTSTDATDATGGGPPDPTAPRDPRRWWALGALALAVMVLGFDATILNVALPTLATGLGADTGQLQWILDAYIVVFAAALLPAGLLGDKYGRRRFLLIGLGAFGIASILGALVHSIAAVITARALMGLGGAFVLPLSMSTLPVLFDAQERPKAVALWGGSNALGMPLGPILGGLLLRHFWWGSIFLINVPVVAIGAFAVWRFLPESRTPDAPRIAPLPSLLTIAGLVAVVYGVIEAPTRGWGDTLVVTTLVVTTLVVGTVLLVVTGWRELRSHVPMFDLRLFRNRSFLWGTTSSVVVMFTMGGTLFSIPQYFQSVLGADALGTGLRLAPMMGGMLLAALFSTRLGSLLGYRMLIPLGLLVVAGALFLGSTISTGDGYGFTAIWITLFGLGCGWSLLPASDAVLGALPKERTGMGSALLQTVRQVANALSVALLGSLLASVYTSHLPSRAPAAARESVNTAVAVAQRTNDTSLLDSAHSAFIHGMDTTLVVCGSAAVLGAVLIAAFLPGRIGRAATT